MQLLGFYTSISIEILLPGKTLKLAVKLYLFNVLQSFHVSADVSEDDAFAIIFTRFLPPKLFFS